MIGKTDLFVFLDFHIFFINSYLIFFALKESAESLLSKSVWVYVFLMYKKNITSQKLAACLILWEKAPTPLSPQGVKEGNKGTVVTKSGHIYM